MIQDGLIYYKTVETNKIVFKGQTYQKITSYIFTLIIFCWALGVSYYIITEQIKNNPSIADYFIAIFFSGLILALSSFEIRTLLTRDKLKEIEITISVGKARTKLLEATANLNWELYSNFDNYMVFRTKNSFLNDCQTVTLIFFPSNRVFFHSINFPNDYIRRSRFNYNYEELLREYQRIEK
ncbi:MAG: hypothetical protein PHV20_06405 [Bacteroidales bacterium]|nr:hypothetical protein [Bacteroidales bacterium]